MDVDFPGLDLKCRLIASIWPVSGSPQLVFWAARDNRNTSLSPQPESLCTIPLPVSVMLDQAHTKPHGRRLLGQAGSTFYELSFSCHRKLPLANGSCLNSHLLRDSEHFFLMIASTCPVVSGSVIIEPLFHRFSHPKYFCCSFLFLCLLPLPSAVNWQYLHPCH